LFFAFGTFALLQIKKASRKLAKPNNPSLTRQYNYGLEANPGGFCILLKRRRIKMSNIGNEVLAPAELLHVHLLLTN
jgi:hypothetical protein